ncbi:MAG: tripartite tricarboxylate transporter substrate binding protein [Firmicutes bacterium]|nr:tripartite tricarboxylate transporter substrate binding protein [Bacillota bacterium]NSW91397.1 tripartite tricarboxylate transporter substrate binding protein [Bacillota bacterium]
MRKMRTAGVAVVILLITMSILAGCSQQQPEAKQEPTITYPERQINMVVGFSPGGPTDVISRGIVPVLQEKMGVGIGITNMPGAASATAAAHVLNQPRDGYTLFFGSEIMSIWQTMGTMDLSPTRDFIPVKLVSEAIPVLAVPPKSPFGSAEEFIQYAKEHPGELRIGTAGPGTVPHISGLLLEKELGCKFTFVPFQGGGPAVTAVMGDQVNATIEMVQGMVEAYKGGQLKILASFTNEPIEGLDIPALGKIVPELSQYLPYGPYFGLFAAKDTPEEVVKILKEKMDEAMADERWAQYCKKLYLVQIDYDGEEAIKYLEDWTSRSAWLLYDVGGATNSPADFGIKRPQ